MSVRRSSEKSNACKSKSAGAGALVAVALIAATACIVEEETATTETERSNSASEIRPQDLHREAQASSSARSQVPQAPVEVNERSGIVNLPPPRSDAERPDVRSDTRDASTACRAADSRADCWDTDGRDWLQATPMPPAPVPQPQTPPPAPVPQP